VLLTVFPAFPVLLPVLVMMLVLHPFQQALFQVFLLLLLVTLLWMNPMMLSEW
jgi:hypothetical protein